MNEQSDISQSEEAKSTARGGPETPAAYEVADVEAVYAKERKKKRPDFYASRVKVHPKRVYGTFRNLKWAVMVSCLAVYYLAPFIRWDRGPNAPDQAILIDFPGRRFYFFFIEIWPQEVYYITGLLILAALVLFLFTSLLGRVWCGYACPQTVWTDLFVWVERFVEGDRNARLKLDRAPWGPGKIGKRVVKHSIWLLIAVATGGAWVFYFADAPTLAVQLLRFDAPFFAYLFIAIFAFTTYTLGGLAREQVCIYMCPWPRIQSAMFDDESMLVTYRAWRGEPRGKHKKGESWEGRGDCVDCKQCVIVCPMGIDIRDGMQLECIHCALCVDACNGVMDKVGRPRGLIGYDSYRSLADGPAAVPPGQVFAWPRVLRPRTLIYCALIVVVAAIMLYALLTRGDMDLSVLRDRNPHFVTLSDGGLRNGYTLKIINKLPEARRLSVIVEGVPGAYLSAVGLEDEGALSLEMPPDKLRSLKVYVTAPADAAPGGSVPLEFWLSDDATGRSTMVETTFRGPE